MKSIFKLATLILLLSGGFSQAGYKSPANGPLKGQNFDGEPIGQLRRKNPDHRPNLPDSPSFLPADAIPASTKAKLLARHVNVCKDEVGNLKWTMLKDVGQAPLKDAALIILFNEIKGPNAWDMLSEERKTGYRNQLAGPPLKQIVCERARRVFVCAEWDKHHGCPAQAVSRSQA
jgi:hypothetical protein